MCLIFLCTETDQNQWHAKPLFLSCTRNTYKQTRRDLLREAMDISEKHNIVSYLTSVSNLVCQRSLLHHAVAMLTRIQNTGLESVGLGKDSLCLSPTTKFRYSYIVIIIIHLQNLQLSPYFGPF